MADKIQLQNEAFDLYFAAAASNLSQRQRESLPLTIYRGLFLKNQNFKVSSLSFMRKLYILLKALNKRFFLVIEDQENGISPDNFMAFVQAEKARELMPDSPWENSVNYSFCLADKSLVEWLSYLGGICDSPAYKYSLKLKNENLKQFPKFKEEITYLTKLLVRFETKKRAIERDRGITMSELYLLLYLYDGGKKKLPSFYNDVFKYTIGCSRRTMTDALRKMLFEKSVEKFGGFRTSEYRITPYGAQMVNEIIKSHIVSE